MGFEWPKLPVGSLARSVSDTHNFGKDKLVFLNTSDILHGKILHRTYSPIHDWPGQAKKSIRKHDILFSEIRPANGRWAYIGFDADDFVVSTKLMVIRADDTRLMPKFFYHFLTSPSVTGWLQHIAESRSGTFPQITFDQVSTIKIGIPPLSDQAQIVSFLDELNGKIESTSAISETLEAIARAIFKSWFVDFDPVRAKAEGREPEGMDAATAALFPDAFEDSELGAIPRGWRVGSILAIATLLSGGTPKTDRADYWGGPIEWASAKDVSQCRDAFLIRTERRITETGLAQSSTKLIPAHCTAIVARGATTGRLALFGKEMAMNQTCYALSSTTESPFALYCQLRNLVSELLRSAHGSVFETITTSTFSNSRISLPPPQILEAIEDSLRPLFERILANTELSSTLGTIRDGMLPRLISGKLRVPEAEKLVEAVL